MVKLQAASGFSCLVAVASLAYLEISADRRPKCAAAVDAVDPSIGRPSFSLILFRGIAAVAGEREREGEAGRAIEQRRATDLSRMEALKWCRFRARSEEAMDSKQQVH